MAQGALICFVSRETRPAELRGLAEQESMFGSDLTMIDNVRREADSYTGY